MAPPLPALERDCLGYNFDPSGTAVDEVGAVV